MTLGTAAGLPYSHPKPGQGRLGYLASTGTSRRAFTSSECLNRRSCCHDRCMPGRGPDRHACYQVLHSLSSFWKYTRSPGTRHSSPSPHKTTTLRFSSKLQAQDNNDNNSAIDAKHPAVYTLQPKRARNKVSEQPAMIRMPVEILQ